MMNQSGFLELEKNLEATIDEACVKLGFIEGQSISIYYNNDYLTYVFHLDNEEKDKELLSDCLDAFTKFLEARWGKVQIVKEKNRYKVSVPPEGIQYVVDKNKNHNFLKDLIEVMTLKDCSLERILSVFHKYSEEVVLLESNDEEFDYILYFKDKNIDPFKYCFTFNEMGSYYHRLTDYDFEKL